MRGTLLMTKIFFSASLLSIIIVFIMLEKIRLLTIEMVSNQTKSQGKNKYNAFKYILQYTSPYDVPFIYLGVGREGFISRNCSYTNCIVTSNSSLLGNLTNFDAVIFAGPEVLYKPQDFLPTDRSARQKYVFACIESSSYYPVCSNRLDGYFNWSWTFRLDSEVRWGYMDVRDWNDKLIGPNKIMHWMRVQDMDPVSDELKKKLRKKSIAAAWFVSNCVSQSGRSAFAAVLKHELKRYRQKLDIFGECGSKNCSRERHAECMNLVDETYYFYLSFENSFSEDYATEKLLQALKIDVIPVVYGEANYTRFMPDGIYLNARELGPAKLAAKMNELINNPDEYAKYFRWKKYYSYHHKHERPETNEYCKMCELLNDEEQLKRTTVIENFRDWWDRPKVC